MGRLKLVENYFMDGESLSISSQEILLLNQLRLDDSSTEFLKRCRTWNAATVRQHLRNDGIFVITIYSQQQPVYQLQFKSLRDELFQASQWFDLEKWKKLGFTTMVEEVILTKLGLTPALDSEINYTDMLHPSVEFDVIETVRNKMPTGNPLEQLLVLKPPVEIYASYV